MGQFSVVIPDLDMQISLNETATGAHWAQKTLDTLWAYLDRVKAVQHVEENPEQAARLATRMRHLAIAAPVFAPFSPLRSAINGKMFAVTKGRLRLWSEGMSRLSGAAGEQAIETAEFTFADDHAVLHFTQGGTQKQLIIGTDGTRRQNILPLQSSPTSRVELAGWWEQKNTFAVAARWVETCFEVTVHFTFDRTGVAITHENTVGGFDAMRPEGTAARAEFLPQT